MTSCPVSLWLVIWQSLDINKCRLPQIKSNKSYAINISWLDRFSLSQLLLGEQKCSRNFFISYSALNLPRIFLKLGKFENFIPKFTEEKFEEKNGYFPFTLAIRYWKLTAFAQKQNYAKILFLWINLTSILFYLSFSTHFSHSTLGLNTLRLCFLVHGLGWVCLGSCGCVSQSTTVGQGCQAWVLRKLRIRVIWLGLTLKRLFP